MSSRYDTIPQRVFNIFLRPYQVNTNNKLVKVDFDLLFWKDPSVQTGGSGGGSQYVATKFKNLFAMTIPSGTGADAKYLRRYSDALGYKTNSSTSSDDNIIDMSDEYMPLNNNYMFTEDVWFLHSCWTSFEETKLHLRPLIDKFGMDAVMCCAYVPLDLELLPSK